MEAFTNTDSNNPQQETLILINETEHWSTITSRLEDIANGKVVLAEIVLIIDSFAKKFGLTKRVNTFALGLYLLKLNVDEQNLYQNEIFPKMAKLILRTSELFPTKIPLFLEGVPQSIKLSKEQCACLLAHMFMCVTVYQDVDINFPINFSELFTNIDQEMNNILYEKLKCIFNYFKRVFSEPFPKHYVEFTRLVREDSVHGNCSIEDWRECEDVLSEVEVRASGKIEDADGAIKIDFANMYLGGGVLSLGRVQEEIMFTVAPEHIVGMLFCECMNAKEAICIRGAERYCNYRGYADTFEFVSDYRDKHRVTDENIVDEEVIAVDAIYFGGYEHHQFSEEAILRELNKAYVGFFGTQKPAERKINKPLSTGKWGCGAFLGDTQLKFIIQWISASRAGRKMIFYSFGDTINMYGYEKILKNYEGKKVKDIIKDLLIVAELKVQADSLKVKGVLGNLDKRLKAKKEGEGKEDEEINSKVYNKTENIRLFEGLMNLDRE